MKFSGRFTRIIEEREADDAEGTEQKKTEIQKIRRKKWIKRMTKNEDFNKIFRIGPVCNSCRGYGI
jgi:hypothetical protein